VRTGVIGAGGLGIHHVRILRDMQGPDFAGFYESRTDRAEQVATELGVRAHPTLESLLDAVDAVTIVVPTPGHYDVAKQVLARGIHAMIEKPLAATLEQADEMLHLATTHGAILQTGHVERFNRGVGSGDFGPMLAAFAPDAEMAFEGAPAGPFRGRQAIAAAYAATPPDDQVLLLGPPRVEGEAIVGDYAWAASADRRAGRMLLTPRNGMIARLVVTFEPAPAGQRP